MGTTKMKNEMSENSIEEPNFVELKAKPLKKKLKGNKVKKVSPSPEMIFEENSGEIHIEEQVE